MKKVRLIAKDVLEGRRKGWRVFLGPAFIASVAYVDPGNFASNIQSGAEFGYLLVWVVILANLMGMLIQLVSAKLGIASGKNLAEHCRDNFSRPWVIFLWIQSEIVAICTDLAEFIGAALGFTLLFHIPLFASGLLTGVISFLLLTLQKKGFRPLEIVISGFVGVIVIAFAVQVFFADPSLEDIFEGFIPRFTTQGSVLLATAILGATVMPHVIFLHSALTQKRIVGTTEAQKKKLFRYQILDVIIAMGIAGIINLAMLVLAAAVFHEEGLSQIQDIEGAFYGLKETIGRHADTIFGIALLASGLSSSLVGTMAGQIVMQGFVRFPIPLFLRRLITMLPSLIILASPINPTKAMIFSQVVLSFGIPFAIIPLILFTSKAKVMKNLVNSGFMKMALTLIAFLVISLNIFLIYQSAF